MKVIQEIKNEWKKKKITTSFYFLVLTISILSYLKPTYTKSVWSYFSISAIQLSFLALLIFLVYWFWWRKK